MQGFVSSGARKCESKSSTPCSSQATADAGHEVPEKGCTLRLDAGGGLWPPDQLGRNTMCVEGVKSADDISDPGRLACAIV